MAEREWLTTRSVAGLDLKRSTAGQHRKCRLFGVACCRRAMTLAPDRRLEGLADLAERFADGSVTWDELKLATAVLKVVRKELGEQFGPDEVRHHLLDALGLAAHKRPSAALNAHLRAEFAFAAASRPDFREGCEREEREQVRLAHDIFGNPFRPVAFDPAWRTDTAAGIAATMYEARDFAAMPVLADALEEAGCDHPAVLLHCREPGVHVRGCWVVDLVLGKV